MAVSWYKSIARELYLIIGIVGFLMITPTARADLKYISFDQLSVGTIVTNQFPGVTISLLGTPTIPGPRDYVHPDAAPIPGPRIYALADTRGNPQDVFGASGNAITPGDNVGGINPPFYDIDFQFSQEISYFSIQSIDAEVNYGLHVLQGNQLVQVISGPGSLLGFYNGSVFHGPSYVIGVGAIGGTAYFDRVVVSLSTQRGPPLYDNVQYYAPIPEIPAVALFAFGIVYLYIGCRNNLSRKRRVNSLRGQSMRQNHLFNV